MLDVIFETAISSGFVEALVNTVFAVLIAVLAFVGDQVRKYFKELSNEKELEKAKKYLDSMDALIEATVNALNGTIKAELLEKAEDGKITKEEGQDLLLTAINTVKVSTSPAAQQAIGLLIADIDEYIRLKIESILVVKRMQ